MLRNIKHERRALHIPWLTGGKNTHRRESHGLPALWQHGVRFTGHVEANRIIEQALNNALQETSASVGYIMLVNESGTELTTEVAASRGKANVFPSSCALGEGLEGYVAQTRKPTILSRGTKLPGGSDGVPSLRGEVESALCIPLVERAEIVEGEGDRCLFGSGLIGVMTLLSLESGGRFQQEDLERMRGWAGFAATALVNARMQENQRGSFMRSLHTLVENLEAKDVATSGHSKRVAQLCVLLAERLRVDPEVIEELRQGALLHEVGMIGIPEAILFRPGSLSDDEFELLKTHTVIGYEICKPLGLSEGILMMVRNHHERLDGTGYPDGLKQGDQPLALRIMCVADAFDAMSSYRHHRGMLESRARNEQLNRFAGTQFDPIVVETLKSLLNAGELDELYQSHEQTPPTLLSDPLLDAA